MQPLTPDTFQVFQFHDIAAVTVSSTAPFARDFFNAEYGYHSVTTLPENLPDASLNFRLDQTAPEGFSNHSHKLLARWQYKFAFFPNNIHMDVYGNRAAVSMVHHMMVHPSLRWLAAGHETLLLHAGAVAKNGKSLIFTGKGGAGKTTTTSLVLGCKQGWQIHADDYVFLQNDPEPQSKAYVTRSHLYHDLLNWVPEIHTRLTSWERTRLEFFGALRKYSREGIKWPVRLAPTRLWPGTPVANAASPAGILLLERADISKPAICPVQNLDDTASDLLEMNFSEARHFLTLLKKAGALDDQWLAAWKEKELNLLADLLRKNPIFKLVLPFSQSAKNAQSSLLPLLDDLVR